MRYRTTEAIGGQANALVGAEWRLELLTDDNIQFSLAK
jgi:hypothetical protein